MVVLLTSTSNNVISSGAGNDTLESKKTPALVLLANNRVGTHFLTDLQLEEVLARIRSYDVDHWTEILIISDNAPQRLRSYRVYNHPQKTYSVNLPPHSTLVSTTVVKSDGEPQVFVNTSKNHSEEWSFYSGRFTGSFVEFQRSEEPVPSIYPSTISALTKAK